MAAPARARTQDVKPAADKAPAPAPRAPAPKPMTPGAASRQISPVVATAILDGAAQTPKTPAPITSTKTPKTAPPPFTSAQSPARVVIEPGVVVSPAGGAGATLKGAVAPSLKIVPKSTEPIGGPTAKTADAKTPEGKAPPSKGAAAKGAAIAPPESAAGGAAGAAPTTPEVAVADPAADAKGVEPAKKSDAAPAATGGAPEGEGGAGGGAAAVAAVALMMPEAPSGPSPATKKRIGGVTSRAGKAATAKATLPDGASQVGDARQSVNQPDAEAKAHAQADLIAMLDKQPEPSPEIVKLCERIRKVIREKRPPDEDALVAAKPEGEALDAGNQLNSSVDSETKKVQDNYGPMQNTPGGAAPAQGQELKDQPPAAATPGVNAKAAAPDAVPDKNVSLDADAEASKKKMQEAGMDSPTAQAVQSGPIAEARGAQGELEQAAKEDPAKVLASQKEALAKAEDDMAGLQLQALSALTQSRASGSKGATSRQKDMAGTEESRRAKVSGEAQETFATAQKAVKALLEPLAKNAIAEWDAAKTVLVSQFKTDLAVVKQRVDDRHSGVGGFFVGLWDAVTGLPGWAEEAYTKAEYNFSEGVIAKITEVSVKVNTVIATCELLIKQAKDRIAQIFADAKSSLGEWAVQEQAKFDKQLDQLKDDAYAARDSFNKDLIDRSSQAVDEVRAEISELRKKAGGLVGRIANAINRFLDDPVKFIIEGLLEILGIPPASFWAVVAKIKKVVKDIADDPMKFANNLMEGLAMGFGQFFDNILTHLLKGFISWLTGSLGDVGVQLPKDLSLKSLITFFLQLMGITWPRIRKVLAKHVGEKNVALLEKVYSLVSFLIEKGPEGIFEMIKEKLDPQSIVDQVVQLAVDFLISAVVKAATARILLLFNPAGAIFQALEAIYRVLKWIFQNAARIFTLIETVVNGIADILAGSLGGFANAVEKALGMLIAPVISFIADYLGFGDLPDKIAKKIKSFQDWIMSLIEKVLVFMIEKGKALLAALGIGGKDKDKRGAGADDGLGEKVPFSADGQAHTLWIAEKAGGVVVMVKSDAVAVETLLSQFDAKLKGKTDKQAQDATKLIGVARSKLQATEKEAKEEQQADTTAKGSEDKGATDAAVKARGETVQKEESLADVLGQIFALVHGGDNILGLLDKHIINRGADSSDRIKDQNAVNEMTAAKYVVYSQNRSGRDKYFVRRSDVPKDESERPQVHFSEREEPDGGGRLALGSGSGKAGDDEKIEVYKTLLKLANCSELAETNLGADAYRDKARTKIVKKLASQDGSVLLQFMEDSKVIPPSYNRLRGDIFDEWLTESGTRSYTRPGPVFRKKDYPKLTQDRQADGSRGKRLYDAKGHGGRGPSGDEIEQYHDYLTIIDDDKSGYNALVYVILDPDARDKWEGKCPRAKFAP